MVELNKLDIFPPQVFWLFCLLVGKANKMEQDKYLALLTNVRLA
jgi:hypothetical protein